MRAVPGDAKTDLTEARRPPWPVLLVLEGIAAAVLP